MNVSRGARDALRQLSYRLSADTGQRITMDTTLRAALSVAAASPDLTRAATLAVLEFPTAKD
jgi:hypothetical protein